MRLCINDAFLHQKDEILHQDKDTKGRLCVSPAIILVDFLGIVIALYYKEIKERGLGFGNQYKKNRRGF